MRSDRSMIAPGESREDPSLLEAGSAERTTGGAAGGDARAIFAMGFPQVIHLLKKSIFFSFLCNLAFSPSHLGIRAARSSPQW